MNIVSKKVSAFVFSVIVVTSVVGMENENVVEITTEQVTPAAWYRKGSVQAAAVAITLAAVGCAYVVREGKVAIPAFVAALIVTSQTVQSSAPRTDATDDVSGQITEAKNQEISVSGTVEGHEQTKSFNDMVYEAIDFVKSVKLPTWDEYKSAVENMTEEDFKQMNEALVR